MADTQFNPLLGASALDSYYKGIPVVPPNPHAPAYDGSVVSRMKYTSKVPPPTESRRSSSQTEASSYETAAASSRRSSRAVANDDGNIASYLQIPASITEVSGNLAELAAKVGPMEYDR